MCWLWNQIDIARIVTEREKLKIHMPKYLLVIIWGGWTCVLSFVCWTCSEKWFGPAQELHQLTPQRLLSYGHHAIIWTNQSPAYVLPLSLCVSVKLIHVDRSDRKISMPPDLNTGVRNAKTEPIATQFAILPPPYLCIKADFTWYLFLPVHTGVS